MELKIWYKVVTELPPHYSGVPDAETCRAHCECRNDAPFFHWNKNNKVCRCLETNDDKVSHGDSTSGVARGCSRNTSDDCLVEENIALPGFDVNNGLSDPRQNDAESCRSFCKANYPTAMYFDWTGLSFNLQTYHKTCWCKTSNAGRKADPGIYSGEVCRG